MKTKPELTCLRKLLDQEAQRFLSIEAALFAILSQWLTPGTYYPLALLIRNYQTVVKTHISILKTIIGPESPVTADNYNNLSLAILIDADERMRLCKYPEVREASLIAAIQNMMHLKITGYGTVASFAAVLDLQDIAADFHRICEDEKYYDEQLSYLAKHEVNNRALEPLSQLDPLLP